MNLHRTDSEADWHNIAPAHRNRWQNLAAATAGTLTPGNIITVAGFAIVAAGLAAILHKQYAIGLACLVVGRGFDLLDGIAAESTGTKSPLGEAFDATFDKLGTAATLAVYGVAHVAPWWILLAIAAPHLIISILALRADRQGKRFHPSRMGKYSMAIAWLALLGLLFLPIFHLPAYGWSFIAIYVAITASIVMGIYAAFGYATGRD